MDFISLRFGIFILCAFTAYYLSPARYRTKIVLPVLNLIFILAFIKNPIQLLPFLFFLLSGFISVKIAEAFPSRKIAILEVLAVVFIFIYLKKYAFVSFLPFISQPYMIVGISYVLFRVLHILIDVHEGAIKEKVSLLDFFNYTCFFLTFISGPIQRFQDYKAQELPGRKTEFSRQDVFGYFSRIVNGYFKIAVLSALFFSAHSEFLPYFVDQRYVNNIPMQVFIYAGACFFYTLHLYYNFSGYTDVVIGLGHFFGFRLPENFDRPFSSKNFLEFWSRWHMTLSGWFRTYVFNPLVKTLAYRWPDPDLIPFLGITGFFITFMFMGIWHGSTFPFVIFGLFLGLGTSVNKLYQLGMTRLLGRQGYAAVSGSKLYRLICQGSTFGYFSIGLTCFWADAGRMKWLYGKIGIPGFAAAFVAMAILAVPAIFLAGSLPAVFARIFRRIGDLSRSFYAKQGWLALKLFIVLLFVIAKVFSVPEFIYKAF